MILFENPFYTLDATTRDSRQTIMQKAEDKSLELEPNLCSEARLTLTNSRKRLEAEVSWLIGLNSKRIKEILKDIKDKSFKLSSLGNLSALAKFNLIGTFLSTHEQTKAQLKELLLEFAQLYHQFDIEKIQKEINEDRSVAGLPEIEDTKLIATALEAHTTVLISSISNRLKKLSLKDLSALMLNLVETSIKKDLNLFIVDEFIDKSYTLHIKSSIDTQTEDIKNKIKVISDLIDKTPSRHKKIEEEVDTLIEKLRKFDSLLQPIQLSMQRRGLEHARSKEVAYAARSLAIDLAKLNDDMKISEKLMKEVKTLFCEVTSVNERVEKDLSDINNIRTEIKEREKDQTCYIQHDGWFDKRNLSITPKTINCCGLEVSTKSVVGISYGLTRKYTNGIYTGTDTSVKIRTDYSTTINVDWLTLPEYEKFVSALWMAVGVRLLVRMLEEIALGYDINGFIYDDGIILKAFLRKPLKFKWTEVEILNSDGNLIIRSSSTPSYKKVLSYQYDENTHVINALVRTFFEKGGRKITETFKITKNDVKDKKTRLFGNEVVSSEAVEEYSEGNEKKETSNAQKEEVKQKQTSSNQSADLSQTLGKIFRFLLRYWFITLIVVIWLVNAINDTSSSHRNTYSSRSSTKYNNSYTNYTKADKDMYRCKSYHQSEANRLKPTAYEEYELKRKQDDALYLAKKSYRTYEEDRRLQNYAATLEAEIDAFNKKVQKYNDYLKTHCY